MSFTLIWVAALMALVSLCGAALPMARRWSQQGLHLFVAVAVGIFLGTLFLHLMPELAHGDEPHGAPGVSMAAAAAEEEEPRGPWIAAMMGLLTLFLIEKIWLQGKSHVHVHALPMPVAAGPAAVAIGIPAQSHEHAVGHGHDHDHPHVHDHSAHGAAPTMAEADADHVEGEACDHDPHSFDLGHTLERHSLVWYASFLGLTIHAMLDGLNTSAVMVGPKIPWPFLASMLVHKASEGFSLATVIRLAGVPTRQALTFLFIFAMMSPLGIGIGGVVAHFDDSHMGLLRGFACGSFLYVAVYDLLPEVFHDAQQRILRCAAVALGILIVAVSVFYLHGG